MKAGGDGVIVLGALGAISGAVGGLLPAVSSGIPTSIHGVMIHETMAPLHVPLLFGAALAVGLRRAERTGPGGLGLMGLFVVAAWLLAINVAGVVGSEVDRLWSAFGGSGGSTVESIVTISIAGAISGLVGAATIALGAALVSKGCRRRKVVVAATLAGAVAGALFFNEWLRIGVTGHARLVLLYVAWQAAVAGSLGLGLPPRTRAQFRSFSSSG